MTEILMLYFVKVKMIAAKGSNRGALLGFAREDYFSLISAGFRIDV
jgi:hypothetical protein